ncbi:MAG: alanine--tRNA ligase, partial [Alphaproteobacteria bacterium]
AADRLLVTVHSSDEDAAGLWQRIAGLDDRRIIRIPTDDNFWSMGEVGPRGPCSEIFYDHGDHIAGGPPGSADEDGDRFVEIWNLVFMQFERAAPGADMVPLPRPSIDTGMGLERIAAVLQGVHDNYDIDLMRALIVASAEASATKVDGAHAVAHRVIADHLRASAFLIADGVLPSNEGRGYVLRRIMRRAMRHAHQLGIDAPLLWKLVGTLAGLMGQAFPELVRARPLIEETLKLEEIRFRQTLDRGLGLLAEETARLPAGAGLPGDVAFKLYDTYGFPLDLTQDVLRAEGRDVDVAGFDVAMDRQRAEARASWKGSGETATEAVWFELRERLGATEFLGYEIEMAEGTVGALLVDGDEVARVEAGTEAAVVVNQTPFYAESGGQMGDAGAMFSAGGTEIAVRDTVKRAGDLHVHLIEVSRGALAVGDTVELRVEGGRRRALRANHSATHLLHEALRRRLGAHVTQKGSLVAPDRLRFDFSQPKALTPEDLAAVEADVNERVWNNDEVSTRLMTPDAAIEAGALALFGEKYGDEVRVVAMGEDDGARFSTELCGGTHVRRTGDIGLVKIVAESAVASGVRRIEAVTGPAATAYLDGEAALLHRSAAILKTAPAELPTRIAALVEERKKLTRELSEARKALASGGGAGDSGPEPVEIGGVRYVARLLDDVPARELKGMADDLKAGIGSGVVALVSVAEGKASLVVGVTDDLVDKIDAVELVRTGAACVGGKGGGGRPNMAQAGGPDTGGAQAALDAIAEALKN